MIIDVYPLILLLIKIKNRQKMKKQIFLIIGIFLSSLSFAQKQIIYKLNSTSTPTNPIDTISFGNVSIGEQSDSLTIIVVNESSKVYYVSMTQLITSNPEQNIIAGKKIINTDNYCELELGFDIKDKGQVQTISNGDSAKFTVAFAPKSEYQFRKINEEGTNCNGPIETVDGNGFYQKISFINAQDGSFINSIGYRLMLQGNGGVLTSLETNAIINKGQVINAFDLMGNSVPVNTKGKPVILQYSNGEREKVFIQE